MAYQRKTEDEFRVMYDYGYGPEELYTATSMEEARSVRDDYRRNEGIAPFIRKVRVKKGGQRS